MVVTKKKKKQQVASAAKRAKVTGYAYPSAKTPWKKGPLSSSGGNRLPLMILDGALASDL